MTAKTSKFLDGKWQLVGGGDKVENFWDYRKLGKGAEFEGVFKETRTNLGKNNSSLHIFEDTKGKEWGIWGNAILDTRFKNNVAGQVVGIRYLGKELSEKSNNAYHNFNVYKQALEGEEEVDISEIDLDAEED